jgi:MurNAc alpha-1-phosphate uridylyltransferase
MIALPRTAMVLAAGLGTRLRPLTLTVPKCLVKVGGKPLIDHTLDRLAEAGVARAVVNLHYLPDPVRAHLAGRTRPAIVLSDETDQLLETGGGLVRALPLLGDGPFLSVNADILWRDFQGNALHRLAEHWEDATMDALLLLQPTIGAIGYGGQGDFTMANDGRLTRRDSHATAPFVFTGVQIVHPRLLRDAPQGPFSLNILYDRAMAAGRLHGLSHDGDWMDCGTPEALAAAERALAA